MPLPRRPLPCLLDHSNHQSLSDHDISSQSDRYPCKGSDSLFLPSRARLPLAVSKARRDCFPAGSRTPANEARRPFLQPDGGWKLTAPTEVDMIDDQDRASLPLQRLSSGGGSSSFGGSLFTVDGNVLSGTTMTGDGSSFVVDGGEIEE